MAEKNIFADQLFLSLNISDFKCIFYVKIATCHEKSHPPLSQQPPLKVEVLSSPSPPLFENLIGGSTLPLSERVGGGLPNGQNPLSVTKVICQQSLKSLLSPKV